MSDDSTIIGKGSEILLPKSGNPFKRPAEEAPRDLSPDEVAARFGKAAPEAASSTGDTPTDLSPEDVAALFPSTQDERNAIPVGLSKDMAALTPAYAPPPPPRQSVAAKEADLSAFDPDAPIEDTPHVIGKADLPPTFVDIGTFNPDAPVGTDTEADIFMPADSSMDEATSIKADAPVSEPPPAPSTDYSMGVVIMPEASVLPPSVESTSLAIGINAEVAPPPAESVPAPEASAAPVAPSIKIGGGIVNVGSVGAAPRPRSDEVSPDSIPSDTSDSSKELPTVPNASLQLPLKEDDNLLKLFVTNQRMQDLWKRIDETEQRVIKDMASLRYQRTANLEKLRTTRNVLLAGRQYYEDALRYIAEVEADLLYIQRVRGWSFRYGTVLMLYNLLWVVILAVGYLFSGSVVQAFKGTVAESFGFTIWISVLAGGLGGVTKSMVSLTTHIVKQDFDSQYTIWYVSSPIAGTILGLFVWMFTQVGLAGINAASQAGAVGGGNTNLASNGGVILYAAIAWLIGFQQNLVFKLVDKLKKVLLNEEEEPDTT